MVLDEAWHFDNRYENFEGVKARGQRKDMVEYGIDATFVRITEASRCALRVARYELRFFPLASYQ